MEREPKWWGPPEAERLYANTKDEAIEFILDDLDLDKLPEMIEVAGYAPMAPDIETTYEGDVLEHILEQLDENYGDPEGDDTSPTEAMKEAEAAFLAVIQKEYHVWMCDEVCRETVNAMDWIKGHRPDWLTSEAAQA
jgi:hypothetical protein